MKPGLDERLQQVFDTLERQESEPKSASSGSVPADGIVAGIEHVERRQSESTPGTNSVPELPEKCWRKGFDEFRRAWGRTTEASAAYLWAGYLVVAGLVLQRHAQLDIGHPVYANFFVGLIGATGRHRKSTAQRLAVRLLDNVDQGVEVSSGIASAEGLLRLLASERNQRVLVNLGELSVLFRKGGMEGTRTLLPFVTDLYDCPPSARLPKSREDHKAIEPFLSIFGASTQAWLHSSLTTDDVRGGLGGRFSLITGEPGAPIPLPPGPDPEPLAEAETVLVEARNRHASLRKYPLSNGAATYWREWYGKWYRRKETEILDCLSQRQPLHAWKVAMVYAALEGSDEIAKDQLEAACAFAEYQREVQKHVLGNLGDSERLKVEQRVKAAYRKHGPLADWELSQKVRHVDARTLAQTLSSLAQIGVLVPVKVGRSQKRNLQEGQG